ncbi:ATP-dependent RNA helicase DDX54 [Aphis gossypii]|uniref:RNA helicase n=1 Tax=Aphis gossypii TaxID=80765 RepID=A0A9P0JII1_APHGO|nr:ATP-dependent RNA helicase DDX54 [Aphis gossypii]XP_027836541.1 ATP-dependent RNA helicase DDX54 [Aphis gossypii]CAH1738888.1 unnamed protein product [Aphis gossypii]
MEEETLIGFNDIATLKPEVKQKTGKRSGGFQAMGLSFPVLKGVLKRGYKVPTPIQRKTIPIALENRDVVAMARTGSGKTACFLIPMFEKLTQHTVNGHRGIRALILSPTRELAVQTLKFLKEIGKFTNLKSAVILGGDPMEAQFSIMHSAPDIIVATPGRFLHLCVEMSLKLPYIQYVVFDEADRLFEMGFGEQLTEIIARLPENRQTLLFSATLPKVLVQFARAGLSDPVLIRLDVESKIPDTLGLGFLNVRPEERDGALLCLLKYVVKPDSMTIIFAPTKHHVDYIHLLLDFQDIPNTFIYSDLDPTARKINASKFQTGSVKTLITTDIAARGIDIPQLDVVINYTFPAKSKLFVHRVGRCARAGKVGQAYSLVTRDEMCYLLDLHLFLGRPFSPVLETPKSDDDTDGLFGIVPQLLLEEELGQLTNWYTSSIDVINSLKTCTNGYKNYIKSRPGASVDSVRRAKKIDLTVIAEHPMFQKIIASDMGRIDFVSRIKNFRPETTVFEMGQSTNSIPLLQMKLLRERNMPSVINYHRKKREQLNDPEGVRLKKVDLPSSNQTEIQETFNDIITQRPRVTGQKKKKNLKKIKQPKQPVKSEHFIPYQPADCYTEEGLAVDNLKSSEGILDLMGDSEQSLAKQNSNKRKWDPVSHKYVSKQSLEKNQVKKIKSESGHWIPITYKSDRYEKWQEKSKLKNSAAEGNDEEEQKKIAPLFRFKLDTRWGRHNAKLREQQSEHRLKLDTKHILKQRIIKEHRRKKNGRKPVKKDKIRKKSAKFNKF